MEYKELGNTGILVSPIGLGGHEYLSDGESRGFNEDHASAITPGYIFSGFGGENRVNVLKTAFEHGINFFDVTMDSEKEAIGRNFKEMPPPYETYIQTRPESMVYAYDENNRKMLDLALLRNEVIRILKLINRDTIDFFNIAPMKAALDNDPDYLEKLGYNLNVLKNEGYIRFCSADTFSGENTYLQMINSGYFDVVYINYNIGDFKAKEKVLPLAKNKEMGIITRESLMKGELFDIAKKANLNDKNAVANAALKWCILQKEIDTVVYGAANPSHLLQAINAYSNSELTKKEKQIITEIKETKEFKNFKDKKTTEFIG